MRKLLKNKVFCGIIYMKLRGRSWIGKFKNLDARFKSETYLQKIKDFVRSPLFFVFVSARTQLRFATKVANFIWASAQLHCPLADTNTMLPYGKWSACTMKLLRQQSCPSGKRIEQTKFFLIFLAKNCWQMERNSVYLSPLRMSNIMGA